MKVTVLSGGVGGARFLRGVVAVVDPDNVAIIGNVGDDIEVLGLHVSPDLDSVLYALAGARRRGARLGPRRRDVERARDRRARSAARRGSGSATATSACTSSARELLRAGRSALGGDRAARRARSASGVRAAARDRRPAAHVRRDAGRARSRSRSGSSRAGIATRSTPSTTPARAEARPAPGVLEAIDAADADRDRAEQPVRLDRADPRRRRDPRRARAAHACPASPSAR